MRAYWKIPVSVSGPGFPMKLMLVNLLLKIHTGILLGTLSLLKPLRERKKKNLLSEHFFDMCI